MSQRRRQPHEGRPEWQCQYRGGECMNARATKIDGSLHHLCQHHRLRANWNQRRSQQRRRLPRRRAVTESASPSPRRRQECTPRLMRQLGYTEWLQIIDELDWHDSITSPCRDRRGGTTSWSENELFQPMAAQLTTFAPPHHGDGTLVEDIFYLIESDISSYIASISSDEADSDLL